MKRKAYAGLAVLLAAGMAVGPAAGSVYAAETAQQKTEENDKEEKESTKERGSAADDSAFQTKDGEELAAYLVDNDQTDVLQKEPSDVSTGEYPEKFDLRDKGVVTPVKFQNPWGTCWGFSAIAAAETSILTSMGKTYEETGLDLSEHHLAWFTRTYINDGSSQDGEGVHMYEDFSGNELNTGGFAFLATSLFSSGIGVVDEETVPYRGKNSNTEESIPGFNFCYSTDDDWSLPDEYKFIQAYDLTDSYELESPAVYSDNMGEAGDDLVSREDAYLGYDQSATDNMKEMLMEGKALSVTFCADQYQPDQEEGEPIYINTADNKWTHYTYDGGVPNHAVTVVGWDDTIPAEDFLDHSEDAYGDGTAHQPEGDGAWIVKNSWGADTESFPNQFSWGVENDLGQSTGYFYISYYDRSLCYIEAFEFDTSDHDRAAFAIDQYDLMQADQQAGWVNAHEISMSNVFTAEVDETLEAVSCQTNAENTEVEFEVYLLDESAASPDDGELAAVENAAFDYAGYHKVSLQESISIAKGQKYSIVVTELIHADGQDYYGITTDMAMGKEATDAYNKEAMREHREEGSASWVNYELPYYSVGVVNPGESYVYVEELGGWYDFSEVIPALQEYDSYSGMDFDNFPVKGYCDLVNEEDGVIELPDLGYAEPASWINPVGLARAILPVIAGIAAVIIAIIVLVRAIIRGRRNKKLLKSQKEEIEELKKELETYRTVK
jgi:C1A family cysteine protease